ncbi:MAG: NAD(P)H-hydrate dehydratase [Bacteroidales bacterium]|nr:NAD(P)H-hydrate dehydratase [Bacteroidales bacterium]
MKILKSSQIKEVDAYTIKHEPIASIDLMERAASTITQWITSNVSKKRIIKIFIGPGNNGGDGLAIARQLYSEDFRLEVFILRITEKLSADSEINLEKLQAISQIKITDLKTSDDFPELTSNDIIIDGLFGSGLTRKLDGITKQLVEHINASNTNVISIDIPSGLFGENNQNNDNGSIIRAKYTLSFQMPKLSFMFPKNNMYVGNWDVLPIGLNKDIINDLNSDYYLITKKTIKEIRKGRNKFSHKGTFGHVLMVSGSYGKMGAAILASKACLRTGSGLVSIHIPKSGYSIMQTAIPEAMLSIDWSDIIITSVPDVETYTSLGIGPGIGTKNNTIKALEELFKATKKPMVIDADALNILSIKKELIELIPKNSILTPHPKEFERLVGHYPDDYTRMEKQIEFAVKNKLYILLKGAHTSIACPDGEIYFNSTGNPGMATAGSGDVLTGIILSLLGQAYTPKNAAILGVYLHGLAGDIAIKSKGQEALIASDIIENIGKAYLLI